MTKLVLFGFPERAFYKMSYPFIPVIQASLQGTVLFITSQDQEHVGLYGSEAGQPEKSPSGEAGWKQ